MSDEESKSISERLSDDQKVDLVVKEAVRKALAEHKRKGNSIAVWRDDGVRLVTAEEIGVKKSDG